MADSLFFARSAANFAARRAARAVLRRSYDRTPSAVIAEYDHRRRAFLDAFLDSELSIEDFVFSDADDDLADDYYFASLIDNRIQHGVAAEREVRRRFLGRLDAAIGLYGAKSIMEVGCGTGRNLLHVKHSRPDVEVVGLDLTPSSVATARAASERYGLDARFEVQDMLQDWDVPAVDLVFSLMALEQLPRGAGSVVERMRHSARHAVVVWEPLPDLVRGLNRVAMIQRSAYLSRLPLGAFEGIPTTSVELLDFGTALNRATELHFPGVAA